VKPKSKNEHPSKNATIRSRPKAVFNKLFIMLMLYKGLNKITESSN
jgi:hypothetical protein